MRERTDRQVLTSAAQMDAALEAGLTAEQLGVLTEARAWWHQRRRLPAARTGLDEALAHPAALEWDAVFVTAARKLSAPARNVRP